MTTVFLFLVLALVPSISVSLNLVPDHVCQSMWNKTANNLQIPMDLKVNPAVPAQRLFTLAPSVKQLNKVEFRKFREVLASHSPGSGDAPPVKSKKEDEFLIEIGKKGGPVEVVFNYLHGKRLLPSVPNLTDFYKRTLKSMWFTMYTKGSGNSITQHNGFQHTFVGEITNNGTEYKGFHNWYQFLREQRNSHIADVGKRRPIQFLPTTEPPYMTALTFNWNGAKKKYPCGSSLFVGTSPAFEIALYSVCFLEYPGQECGCKIGNSLVKVKTHAANPPCHIASAYPSDVSIPPGRCGIAKNDRADCGWFDIDQQSCENRCCCWHEEAGTYDTPVPWCFYPAGHRCEGINPKNRKDCGHSQIKRTECEAKGCCFDSRVPNVPFCFFGEYK